MMDDYRRFRGKCREAAEELARTNPGWRVVRGTYVCPVWGEQNHWWCEDQNGKVHDPTCRQFPSKGLGEYCEFTGWLRCAVCVKEIKEEEAIGMGSYPVCSDACALRLVGLA